MRNPWACRSCRVTFHATYAACTTTGMGSSCWPIGSTSASAAAHCAMMGRLHGRIIVAQRDPGVGWRTGRREERDRRDPQPRHPARDLRRRGRRPSHPGESLRRRGDAPEEAQEAHVPHRRPAVQARKRVRRQGHTRADHEARRRVPKAVQNQLGHASAAKTLDVYADLFDDDLDGVSRAMDALLRREDVAKMLPQPTARASRALQLRRFRSGCLEVRHPLAPPPPAGADSAQQVFVFRCRCSIPPPRDAALVH